jgi:formylglycine-generating enzyme required for sulfatase activity
MTVLGPARVEAGNTAIYTANVRYDNDAMRLVEPVWAIAGDVTAAHIDADGVLSVGLLSEDAAIEVVACFTDGKTAIAGTLDVTLAAPPPRTATVSGLEVQPRRPWNGWVDIDYTLETDPPGTLAKIALSAYDHEQRCALPVKTLAGDGAHGGLVKSGCHRLSWNLGADHPDIPAGRVGITLDAVPSGPRLPCAEACREGGLKASFYDLGGPNPEASPWKSPYKEMRAFFAAREAALVTDTAYLGENFDFGYTERGTCRFPEKYARWTTEAFAVLFEGWIDIPETGTYTFGSLSDDGVSLYVDRKLVYETTKRQNFGDGMSAGTVALKAGRHDIAIAYYEGGGQQGLQLFWQKPSDAAPLPLPQSVLGGGPAKCPPVRNTTLPAWHREWLEASISEYADVLGTDGLWARGRNTKEERAVFDRLLAPIQGDARALGGICEFAERKYREFDAMDEHETPRQWFYTWLKWRTVDDICELGDRDEFKRLQGLYGRDGADSLWFKGYEDRHFPTNGAAGRYLVVDLSGGPHAERWPAAFRDTVPVGGFNTDKYKLGKLVLRRIDPGSFTMGSPPDELGRFSNEDRHPVTLTKPYYIGLFEMTQRQWQLAMGSNPSQDKGAMRPVENTSYDDIRGCDAGSRWPATNAVDPGSLVGKLRAKTGLAFDLPTDAQWEYACRAGTQTALYTGEELSDAQHDAAADEIARYGYDNGTHGGIPDGKGGYPDRHTTVGSYRPNAWGLYDMGGNVWELCRDWYAFSLGSAAATDPAGPPTGRERVRRGGAWDNSAWHCRSASRDHFGPSNPTFGNGFRLACEAE